jgi:hypothetical protein
MSDCHFCGVKKACAGCKTDKLNVKQIANAILNEFPQLGTMLMHEHDNAIVGISITKSQLEDNGFSMVYNETQIVENLAAEGMTLQEAQEYCDFNITSGFVGSQTPLYVTESDLENEL